MEKMQYEEQLRLLERGAPGEIQELLIRLGQQSGNQLRFFNYYKEVPISSNAELLYVFGETLAFRMRNVTIAGIDNAAFRFEKACLVTFPGLPRLRERREQYTHHDSQRRADGFSHH